MKRFMKILHTLGAIGLMGGFGAYLVMLATSRDLPPTDLLVLRHGIDMVWKYLLLPSLLAVIVSGLLSIAVHPPFTEQGWVWIKAATGVGTFEGTLGLQARARALTELTQRTIDGHPDPTQMAEMLRGERGGLWALLFISLVNVVVGVWRPRVPFGQSTLPSSPRPADPPKPTAASAEPTQNAGTAE
jgi:hypothetical protein